ncbi:glucose-1-phosphate cytidylyltransferase [bacterium]|nr:glucose-1-phosphate cytidylyltransferase [bacterium]
MKVVILAGGLGTRLSEETVLRPKPMVEIGGKPILWHIMKLYSAHGLNDFIICLGYKGEMIKDYFVNYYQYSSDLTVDLSENTVQIHKTQSEPWRVTLVDTGADSMTGGRLKRVAPYLKNEDTFCFTYGDGVGDVDISRSIAFHREMGLKATVTVTSPPGRFGELTISDNRVSSFQEKPATMCNTINGGFFVLSRSVLDYIESDDTIWEQAPLQRLANEGNLAAYMHSGFWQPMDTLRDKTLLEKLWASDTAPWKIWA